MIETNQIVVIQSTTGSGKSTQIPQYILEDSTEKKRPCRIIVAEPRRICATNLAARVSSERGDVIGSTVGYQVRLESKIAPTSNLVFMTHGVILRMLMTGQPENFFKSITALIIDEVHERNLYSDFLLLCVRQYIHLNSNLRVIIMSATIQSEVFSDYFSGCPVLQLEGQSFHVEENYLEDILKIVKFSNYKINSLKETFGKDPQSIEKPKSQERIDDFKQETRDFMNETLEKISQSANCSLDFHRIFYLISAEKAPVNFRHDRTNKTALMFAVQYQMESHVLKLLHLKADPTMTVLENDLEISAIDIAKQTQNEKVLGMLTRSMQLLNGPISSSKEEETVESSAFDRELLDLYYDTLVQPGVHRGVFLEDVVDLKLIARLVSHLHFKPDTGGILVFLPGHDDIIQLANLLYNALDMNYEIFILHSQLQTMDQAKVFETLPEGIRKIVLATNIAESSITGKLK